MMKNDIDEYKSSSIEEIDIRKEFYNIYKDNPIPNDQILENLVS